ncbi:MAG: hypothetical protein NVS3B3_10910 [Aquirhabdus sp.]
MDNHTRFFANSMIVMVGTLAALIVGCVSEPIRPMYVPATNYQGLDCTALGAEYARIDTYLRNGVEIPRNFFSGIGFGLGAFGGGWGWGLSPSVTFNAGQVSSSERTVYARLLGERDAVAQQAQYKGCPMILTAPNRS